MDEKTSGLLKGKDGTGSVKPREETLYQGTATLGWEIN